MSNKVDIVVTNFNYLMQMGDNGLRNSVVQVLFLPHFWLLKLILSTIHLHLPRLILLRNVFGSCYILQLDTF